MPCVTLWLASSEPDAAILVYLSEVEADGTVRYVTEGVLRALHRAEAPAPRELPHDLAVAQLRPQGCAADAVGEPQLLRFAAAADRLALRAPAAASGSRSRARDADHFVQTPHGRPPVLTIEHAGSRLELPQF